MFAQGVKVDKRACWGEVGCEIYVRVGLLHGGGGGWWVSCAEWCVCVGGGGRGGVMGLPGLQWPREGSS